jgi:hypothetical protein
VDQYRILLRILCSDTLERRSHQFLWANNSVGGVDIDGIAGKQCMDWPKAVMQFASEPLWNKARGNTKDVIDNLVADGVATWQSISQNRIRVVSGTGGILDMTYCHIWIEVDQTIFEQNPTKATPLGSFGAFNNRKVAYLNCITADTLNVREAPSLSGKVVATYTKGQKINALSYAKTADGNVWFTYVYQQAVSDDIWQLDVQLVKMRRMISSRSKILLRNRKGVDSIGLNIDLA